MSRDDHSAAGAPPVGGLGRGYGEVLWRPDPRTVDAARITRYQRWLAEQHGVITHDYHQLWRWSVTEPARFWDSVWDYFQVLGDRGDGPALAGGPMPDVRWFGGATLNYARNALRAARADPDRIALVHVTEDAPDEGARTARPSGRRMTYGELAAAVARVADGLRALGVGRGDRVAALLPNVPETVIAMLATAAIGAVWSCCSPEFGPGSVIDRFGQIRPTVLLAVDRYRYGGSLHRRDAAIREIVGALPDLTAVILVGDGTDELPVGGPGGPAVLSWHSAFDPPRSTMRPGDSTGQATTVEPTFEDVPFEHPLWVLFSSGTTGLPKPIVHGHGGIVLEHLKTLSFHQDLGDGDVFCWYTTTGWMMWNYLVGGLLVGATVVLYDGSATYPLTDALWRLAADTAVTYLGVGAPYLLACAKENLRPGRDHDLSALRGIGSTGSPLPPEGFRWVYEHVKPDVLLGSFSGGTDVCTGFVGPCPLLPVRAGVIAAPCLGAAVAAFDETGRPVVGRVGELVLTTPMPSMPVGFWNDPDGRRYRDSYFTTYPGVWRHGDWVEMLPDGGCVIYGRSDATLNRGGVRMGTSEFYRVVERFPEVLDSLVVDTGRLGERGRLVLYVVLADRGVLDEAFTERLRAALREELSPRHVPDEIRQVPGIPRTLSGKKLEVPVRKLLLGVPLGDAADPDALANPEVLPYFLPDSDVGASGATLDR